MKQILVTRPPGPARDKFVEQLEGVDCKVLLMPVTSIEPCEFQPEASQSWQAIVFTSGHALRNWAESGSAATVGFDIPCFTVGDSTARLARQLGYKSVTSAKANVEKLATLLVGKLTPENGGLLYPRGEEVAGDLEGLMTAKGFNIDAPIVYRIIKLDNFPDYIKFDVNQKQVDAVCFLSPLAAATFARLVAVEKDPIDLSSTRAICMSKAIEAEIAQISWQKIEVADRPDIKQVLELI